MEVMGRVDECSEQEALPALGLPSSPASSLVRAWYFEVRMEPGVYPSRQHYFLPCRAWDALTSSPCTASIPDFHGGERSSLLIGDFSLTLPFSHSHVLALGVRSFSHTVLSGSLRADGL